MNPFREFFGSLARALGLHPRRPELCFDDLLREALETPSLHLSAAALERALDLPSCEPRSVPVDAALDSNRFPTQEK